MNSALRVLHLEDDPDFCALVGGLLERDGLRADMVLVDNLADFIAAVEKGDFDIILGDYSLPTCTGIDALRAAREKCPDTPFLLVSGTIGEEAAIESLRCGATDYVLKHWPERLVPTVRRAVQEARERLERKRAETELARRERYFRALTENCLDVLAILDRQGAFLYNSPSVKGVLGYEPKEVAGRNAFDLVHPDDAQNALLAFRRALDHPELKMTHECRFRRRDGSWCHLEVVGQNRLDDPEIRGIVLNSRDVTERKALESQLRQAQKMEAIGQLAGGIAHDLNNILTPIVVSTTLLRERLRTPEDAPLLTVLVSSAKRGADIVRQLLWFGRGLEGKRILLNPKHVVKEVARFVSETFDKSIGIQTTVAQDIWAILGDPTHLHQVLLNLCLNSRDAMPSGGELKVEARNVKLGEEALAAHPKASPGPFVVLEVKDTGTGIPPEVRDRIFEPFFTTKEPGKGTGLGLSTALSIVKGYGGFLELESQVGAGTVFRVFLPAKPDSQAAKADAEGPALAHGHGETVLVVDDEEAVCKVVQKALERFGYRVFTARDGQNAVAAYMANQAAISVVLTDLMMPVMDGLATIRALRQINPRVKVIAASGLGSHPNHDALHELGVKYFMAKPYAAETLLQKLQEILAEPPAAPPA